MASVEEVEETILDLLRRLEVVDPTYRAMLPGKRTIEAVCTDLGLAYHADWRQGELSELQPGESIRRPDIRISVESKDLLAMARGDLDFATAYARNRVKVDASMADLLRLRAVL